MSEEAHKKVQQDFFNKRISLKKANRSIRTKILLYLISLILAITLSFLLVMSYFMNSLIGEMLERTLPVITKSASLSIESNLHNLADKIFSMTDDSVIADKRATLKEKQAVLDNEMLGVEYAWLALYDADGHLITGSAHSLQSIASEEYYASMNETQNLVISDVDKGYNDELEVVVAAPKLDGDNNFLYYIVGSFKYAMLEDLISGIQLSEHSDAFIVNNDGIIQAYSDRSYVEEQTNFIEAFGNNQDKKEIAKKFDDAILGGSSVVNVGSSHAFTGSNVYYSYSDIGGANWVLITETYQSDYMDSANTAVIIAILLGCFFLIFAIAAMSAFAGRIQVSLSRVTNRLLALAAGDLSSEVVIEHTRDESQILSLALFEMVDGMKMYISELSRVLEKISHNDLTDSVHGDFKGDFIVMKDSINNIVSYLNAVIQNVQMSSRRVLDTSKLVSDNATGVKVSSDDQSGFLHELKRESDVVQDGIERVRKGAETVNGLVQDVGQRLAESTVQMEKLVTSMSQINTNASEIININVLLENISFQTNILALNAAVEATRAGEFGLGFSVVAEEVRNLATRSSDSSKQTTEVIETTQRSIDEGSRYAEEMSDAFTTIVNMMHEIASITDKLNKAVDEQSSSLKIITTRIDEISNIASSNVISSTQSADASNTLISQADALKDIADQFSVKEDRG
ncbi:MAG: methyl-accepting chemotaxis protein [Clostridiales Family XIII bacterium]|jgi:methyl-accepting chemotaxis protein|nr:methyl-accepting chemotaxis protein [Clostridiales Family XIII bacterium]